MRENGIAEHDMLGPKPISPLETPSLEADAAGGADTSFFPRWKQHSRSAPMSAREPAMWTRPAKWSYRYGKPRSMAAPNTHIGRGYVSRRRTQ